MLRTLTRLIDLKIDPHDPHDPDPRAWNARLHRSLSLFLLPGLLLLAVVELVVRGPSDLRFILPTVELVIVTGCVVATFRGGNWRRHSVIIFATVLPMMMALDLFSAANDGAISVALIVWVVAIILVHGHRLAWSTTAAAIIARAIGLAVSTHGMAIDDWTALAGTAASMIVLTGTVWAAEQARRQAQAAEVRRTQIAEESAEQARSLANAKSQFLAVMSHEIRTPVNGVVNLTRLLQDSGLTDEQAKLVATLQASTGTLVGVLNDVLDFSKIEAGHVQFEQVPVQLPGLIQSAADFYRGNAKERGISLVVELDGSVPPWVQSDPTRLRQILNNLLSNAVKFTPQGRVTVRVRRDGDGRIEVAVQDTGIGIEPGAASTLFDAFAQADTTTTRRFGGTGLGLAICKRLCEGLGGELAFDSIPGEGSTFWVRLPLPLCDSPPTIADADRHASYPTARVLVAEDNEVNQLVVLGLLRRFAIEADVVPDGAEAVAFVRRQPVDLVLMDLHMPVMDGLEATRQIRTFAPDCPVVALTASALDSDRTRCLQAGMNGHLSKPLDPDALQGVLRRWLRAEAPQRSVANG